MEELVHRFLVQSGFPRASLIGDLQVLPLAADPRGNGAGGLDEERPSFAVVDPITGDRLGVIDTVGAVPGDALQERAETLARFAQRFGGDSVQGFLVRVDLHGASPDEQMQLYRVWPGDGLQRLSARTFPDLDSLRTRQMLVERAREAERGVLPSGSSSATGVVDDDLFEPDDLDRPAGDRSPERTRSAAIWLPALALLVLALLDRFLGEPQPSLLSTTQALLLIGAAALFVWPGLARRRDR